MNASWQNRCPGDLRVTLPSVEATPVAPAIAAATTAATAWGRTAPEERAARLREAQAELKSAAEHLAHTLAVEVGKPIIEARAELDAVVAKFDYTLGDAGEHLAPRPVTGTANEAEIRQRAQGPAAVIGPFNVPLHLPNGAICAHLAAGNPVVFKPSPLAAGVAAEYVAILQRHLPAGVLGLVQGGADEGLALSSDPRVRSVCFTGSVAAGRAIAQAVAADFSKSVALELGGKNALLLCADGDVALAARAAAEGLCLTTGQRCNATSRALVHGDVADAFIEALRDALQGFAPGHPLAADTRMGPLVSASAHQRFRDALATNVTGNWIVRGEALATLGEFPGYYVRPAVLCWRDATQAASSPFLARELFAPLLEVCVVANDDAMVRLHNAAPYGLAASVFTRRRARFEAIGQQLAVGNLYANLPTTAASSALPFPGAGESGNGKPAGRGFIRFTTQEQAVQVARGSLE